RRRPRNGACPSRRSPRLSCPPGRTASSAPPIRARWATLVDVAVSYSVVAGAARPGHTAGGVPWVRRGSVRPRAIAVLERGPRGGDTPRVACRGYGAAPSGQEPLRCWSGGRESGTTVGAVPLVGGLPVRDKGQAPENNLHLESLSHCVSDDLRSRRRGRWRR